MSSSGVGGKAFSDRYWGANVLSVDRLRMAAFCDLLTETCPTATSPIPTISGLVGKPPSIRRNRAPQAQSKLGPDSSSERRGGSAH